MLKRIKELEELVGMYVILDADHARDQFAVSLWMGLAPTSCWVGRVIKVVTVNCILVHWAKPDPDADDALRFLVMPTKTGKEWQSHYQIHDDEEVALARFSDFTDDMRVPSWAIEVARRRAIKRLSK